MKLSVCSNTIELETFVDVSPDRTFVTYRSTDKACGLNFMATISSCAFPDRSNQIGQPAFPLPAKEQDMVTVTLNSRQHSYLCKQFPF